MLNLLFWLQRGAVQRVNVNFAIVTANSHLRRVGVHGHRTRFERDRDRGHFSVVLQHDNVLDATDHGNILLLEDVHAARLAVQFDVDARVRVALHVDLFDGVIDAARVDEVAVRPDTVHLVAVTVAGDAVVLAVAWKRFESFNWFNLYLKTAGSHRI